MILLDAIYINNSGGKVLLDYLVSNFEVKGADIFYLLDERCHHDYKEVPSDRKLYMKGSLTKRRRFYVENKNRFSDILCFGNIPPPVNVNAFVMTYLHQTLYLEQPEGTAFANWLKLKVKSYVIRSFSENTDCWAVQSGNIAGLLENKWNVSREKIKVLPFYPPLNGPDEIRRSDNKYLFVSGGNRHKNHYRLIEAFAKFNKQFPETALYLTVPDKYEGLLQYIATQHRKGTKIINHGLLPRQELVALYKASGFVIYPSLAESFGLGLIEAINLGCKVIAANLPYVHAVCKPTLTFDPLSTTSIYNALLQSRSSPLSPPGLKISDQINRILSLFHL